MSGMTINGSVGRNGTNRSADVMAVQRRLNAYLGGSAKPLEVDGRVGKLTLAAIEAAQRRSGMRQPDGVVDPGGRTWRALTGTPVSRPARPNASVPRPAAAEAPAPRTEDERTRRLSGARWWHANQARYPNSSSVDDLETNFRSKAQRFIAALRAAGVNVRVSSTRRNRVRAHLMHYSWKVSHGKVAPADVPAIEGCDIIWDHGDLQRSRSAAREMVRLFAIVYQPSLTSNHIAGTAIDMTITPSTGITVTNGSGSAVRIGSAAALHSVGASFGVHKLMSDPPHWSANGR